MIWGMLTCFVLAMPHHMHEHQNVSCKMQDKKSSYSSQEMIELMHAPMMCAQWVESGNAEIDFLKNMIPHHQGAILSAQALLQMSKDARVRKIAQEIITTQKEEIAMFEKILKNLQEKKTQGYEEFAKKAKEDMTMMMEKMQIQSTGDVDKDFMIAMIPHHQGAIVAAKQILAMTKHQEIKKIAQEIITTQQKEVQEFQELLKTFK